MQLAYDDPSSAYRLQDRISAMHRIKLEKIIEKVLDEFSIPGKVIKIDKLTLDLGAIADTDLELLLPKELEQALRDELGQLMIRKEFDPLIEIDTSPLPQYKLADLLHYLERGARRWTNGNEKFEVEQLLQELAPHESQWFRERLLTILSNSSAVDRLINDVSPEVLPQLLALLSDGPIADVVNWINEVQDRLGKATNTSASSSSKKAVVTQNLVKAWAKSGFATRAKEQAKTATLQALQKQMQVSLFAPLPEQEMHTSDGKTQKYTSAKLLQYLLFYGFWPAGQQPLALSETERETFDLGSYILKALADTPIETRSVLTGVLTYPSARKRLVYQLSLEQLAQVSQIVYPAIADAIESYQNWVQGLPSEVSAQLDAIAIKRTIWLGLLEFELGMTVSSTKTKISASDLTTYSQQAANILASAISASTYRSIQKHYKESAFKKGEEQGLQQQPLSTKAIDSFSALVLEKYQQLKGAILNEDVTKEALTDSKAKEQNIASNIPTQLTSNVEGLDKVEALEQATLQAKKLEEAKGLDGEAEKHLVDEDDKVIDSAQQSKSQKEAIEAEEEKELDKLRIETAKKAQEIKLQGEEAAEAVDKLANEGNEETENLEGAEQPKNQLQAFLYFLRRGIWPEIPTAGNDAESQDAIVVPEAVMLKLLEDSPIALMSELFPMLVSERVRERLAYQLSHEALQQVVTAFATIHEPVARYHAHYQQLLQLVAAMHKPSSSAQLKGLVDAESTFKSFVLWLLYEEPSVKNIDAFVTYFLVYWQGKGQLAAEPFTEAVNVALVMVKDGVPIGVKSKFEKLLIAYKKANTAQLAHDPAELEGEAIEEMTAAMLLMDDEDSPEYNNGALFTPKQTVGEDSGSDTDKVADSAAIKSRENTSSEATLERQTAEKLSSNSAADEDELRLVIADKSAPGKTQSDASTLDVGETPPHENVAQDIRNNAEKEDSTTSERVTHNAETEKGETAKFETAKGHTEKGDTENESARQLLVDDVVGEVGKTSKDMDQANQSSTQINVGQQDEEASKAKFATGDDKASSGANRVEVGEGESGLEEDLLEEDTTEGDNDDKEEDVKAYPLSPASSMPFVDSQILLEAEEEEAEAEEIVHKTLKQKIEQINDKLIPEKVKQAKVVRPKNPFEREEQQGPLEEPVFIENAGMVLLWPFIGRCFTALGYTEKGLFKDMASANRAVHLLQYMVTGEEQTPEYLLVLNKILCGIPLFEAVERDVILTAQEKEEAEVLLRAVIGNWQKMKTLTVPAFRESFLKRGGRITESEANWTLRVDQAAYDMLLDTLPWTIGMIKLRYMEKVLYAEWR